MITDGRQPIGRGIGPVLEARDVMQVLQSDPHAPSDLRQKALRLAGRVLEFDPDVRGGRRLPDRARHPRLGPRAREDERRSSMRRAVATTGCGLAA